MRSGFLIFYLVINNINNVYDTIFNYKSKYRKHKGVINKSHCIHANIKQNDTRFKLDINGYHLSIIDPKNHDRWITSIKTITENSINNNVNPTPYFKQDNNDNNNDKYQNHHAATSYLPIDNLNTLNNDIFISPSISDFESSTGPRKIKCTKINNNTRVGICEHPKHVYYREYNSSINSILSIPSLFFPSSSSSSSSSSLSSSSSPSLSSSPTSSYSSSSLSESTFSKSPDYLLTIPQDMIKATQSIPRRGRPPKGFKSNGVPINNQYSHITMTIRSLPKRLEPVVGKKNIFVCLTCLKRTDLDWDYLTSPLYIGPQSTKKRKI
ncbi:unnamed protein product [Cunninghamella blakesleeana]